VSLLARPMRLVSVNVGEPRVVAFHDREVATGIFKSEVTGPVLLRRLNLEGDRQADLFNHGGTTKAVYAYPSEHYDFWRAEFPGMDLPWGMFGENLTTEGLREEEACIGDELRVGEAVVAVTQPRIPCYKLGIRFGRDDIVKRFFASRRSGIYFSVVKEGLVQAGDSIEFLQRTSASISIADINLAFANSRENLDLLRRIVQAQILPDGLQKDLAEELALSGG
jgi:MOSC domain-containing protein YiiM